MQHLLGEGAFGCVYYAEMLPEAADDNSETTPIAVKMLKGKWIIMCNNFILVQTPKEGKTVSYLLPTHSNPWQVAGEYS